MNQLATRLRSLPFTPFASELLSARLATRLGVGDRVALLVRVGGNDKAVNAQLKTMRAFGDSSDVDEAIWKSLRSIEPPDASTWRWSQLPTAFGDTWTSADRAIRGLDEGYLHGNPARGVVRVIAAPTSRVNAAELTRAVRAFTGTLVIESLPAAAWAHVDSGVADDPVSRSIRRTFNPAAVLNAGILGGD